MLTYIAVMVTLIFLTLLYILRVLNNGFAVISIAIETMNRQCRVLIGVADKIIGKYKQMTSSIEQDIKG
jgi:hypothetical protein